MPKAKFLRLTLIEWVICAVACVGFAFDTYELLVLTLTVQPALSEFLVSKPGSPNFNQWIGVMFYVPAIAGGIFGLLGGYFIDRFGRRRILFWSILLFCFSAFATAGCSTAPQLLFYRCLTFVGVSVEFVAATAWLAELFPERKLRETVLGITQIFSSVGGILMSGANYLSLAIGSYLPAIHGGHEAWRYTILWGIFPAIPLLVVRPFLPESPIWQKKREEGTLQRPSILELFRPEFRKTALLSCLMMACAYAVSFGMLQHFARVIPGTPAVRVLARTDQQKIVAIFQSYQEFGGLFGRSLMAVLAIFIVSRRRLLRLFQIPGLILVPIVVLLPAVRDTGLPGWGVVLLGVVSVAQFSFWGNYLPTLYPTHLRGTGESFAANVGGRMLGTSAALITTNIVAYMPASSVTRQLGYAAAMVGFAAYAIGFIASFWLPEPRPEVILE
ncbi:MAG: MFS transporter [Acidobacteriia bacterium]|nr:MFS transporter [Terriglobia bacterium]